MSFRISKLFFYVGSFFACAIMAMTAGCASGGFKLTRQYAGFVNKQNLIIRIVLYILTGVVFAATMLIDMVIFNTMDFWEGRVSQGTYEFQQGDKTYVAQHEILPGTQLKHSTIKIFDSTQNLIQQVVLQELPSGEIEMSIDGQVRTRVRDVSSLPVATFFDAHGDLLGERVVFGSQVVAQH